VATEKDASGPSQPTVKRLFALSGNRCAFPECRLLIVQGRTVTGDICHIEGRKPGSARYDVAQTAQERHGYENLILLCKPHHAMVDSDSETYSVARLREMKASHERRATPILEAEAEQAAELLMTQQVTSVNQTGGITAHAVNIINQAPTAPAGARENARFSPFDDYTFV
jgi:hypothetical protein